MADQGPTALGQDAPQIEAGARSSADASREQAAPDFSPLKGAKLVPHGDAKANLRAQLQSELQGEGMDTSALSNQAPSPMPSGPPAAALADANTDQTGGPVLAENPSNPVVSHNVETPPPSAAEAIGDSAKATGKEFYNGLARGALGVANGLGFAGVGAMHLATSPFRTAGVMSEGAQGDADQKVFDFIHNYVDTAKQFWTVPDSESNPYAKGVGSAAEALAPLIGGEAGVPAMIASAGMDQGKDVIDQRANQTLHERTLDAMANGTYNAQSIREGNAPAVPDGDDVTTAVTLAVLAAGTNALAMKLPLKNPSVIKRIASAVGLGMPLNAATEVATKLILKNRGFQSAADKIDPTDPSSLVKSGLMQTVFGVLGEPGNAAKIKDAQGATPPRGARVEPYIGDGSGTPPATAPAAQTAGAAAPVEAGEPVTAGTEAGASSPPAGGTTVPAPSPQPSAPIPDKPTAEPVSDLRAQFKDMGNSATPRNAVFISTDNAENLKGGGNKDKVAINNQIARAEAEDRTVDTGNGTLIVKSKKLAADATARLKAGEDPQSVIGELTGAGTGKRPDQSHVVQGQTPEGAVVNETSVAPHEIPAAVEAVKAQGNEPVITTPQEAVQRRAELVQAENATATPETRVEPETLNPEVVAPAAPAAPIEKPVEPPAAAGPASVEAPVEKPPVKPASEAPAPEQKAPVAKPAATPKFDKQKVDIDMKRVNNEEPEDMSREEINAYYNRVRGIVGDGMPKLREIFPDGFNEDTEVTDAVSRAAREALEAKHATEELPSAPVAEPVAKTTPKAVKPKTGMESLQSALTQHEMLDTPRDGRRFATSLEERKENGANFGAVLEQAAKESADAKPQESARAAAVAKKMQSWYNLSENAVVKGQGISHTTVDAVAKEAHSAARELLGKGTEADRPTGLKVSEIRANAEVKAKQAKAKAKSAAPVKTPKAKPTPVVDKDVEAAASKMTKLSSEFMDLDRDHEAEARAKLGEIEEHVTEFLTKTDKFNPDTVNSILHHLTTEREAKYDKVAPSATMGESVGEHVPEGESVLDKKELTEGGGTSIIHRALSAVQFLGESASEKLRALKSKAAVERLQDELTLLADNHKDLMNQMSRDADSGKFWGSHDLLKAVLADPRSLRDAPVITNMLMKLAHVAPDVPVFPRARMEEAGLATTTRNGNRVDLKNMTVEQRAERMAQHVQLNMMEFPTYRFQTLFHELWHTATAYELDNNPNGEFSKQMESAYTALRERMANKYGEDAVNNHVAYFNSGDRAMKPTDYMPHLYGLTNAKEMVSEIWTNPKFMAEVIDSENHTGGPAERAMGDVSGKPTLLERIFGAIGKLFGANDPRLMKHIMQLSMDVGAEQKRHFGWFQNTDAATQAARIPAEARSKLVSSEASPLEQARAAGGLRNLSEPAQDLEPKWLETEVNAAIRSDDREANDPDPAKPDTVIGATRNTLSTMKGKSLDALRSVNMKLKSWDQLLRDHVSDFGADNAANPMRVLQAVKDSREQIMHRLRGISRDASASWAKLTPDESLAVSKVMRDSTNWSIDPRLERDEQSLGAKSNKAFDTMFDQITNAYSKLPPHVQDVYEKVTDLNSRMQDERRRAGIDTAMQTFDTSKVDPKAIEKLYAARHPSDYDRIVGTGKDIDIGDDNQKLIDSLKDFSAAQEMDGPYHHLGRQGEYVVQPEREGTKSFDDKAKAQKFAETARTMSPDAKATIREGGGQHHVDYEIQYTSMHETEEEANAEKDKLNAAGFETGNVTKKTTDQQNAPLSYGMKELLAEAERKLQKGTLDPKETEAQVAALRSSFLQIQAARSAYAGSRLARRNFGGVLAKDMRRNFSDHTMSTIWHIGQMRTVFDEAKAMAALRTAARDRTLASQRQGIRRGEVVKTLNDRNLDEVQGMGLKSPLNTVLAKLAFYRYLASPSHALIWMTQNPTAGMAIGGAKWGYGKTGASITRTGLLTVGPAMRSAMKEAFRSGGNSQAIHDAVLARIEKSPRYAQYAPQLRVMMERGVISHSYADEMTKLQQSQGNTRVGRATDLALQWARMMPAMADAVNRTSSALTGLELTGGDVRQATDYVNQTHADYSAANKPLLFKQISRLPGGNTLTAFMTYQQNMMHLLYGNIASAVSGRGNGGRMQASKTVAGLMIANSLFAGVYAGSAILPIQLAAYAYKKMQAEGEVADLETATHHFLVDHFGSTVGNVLNNGVVASTFGINLKSRMGLADLFFRDMPDLLSGDVGAWKDFVFDHSGTFISDMANSVTASSKAMGQGDIKGALNPWVPFKIYQDSVKAAGLWEDGKRNGYGSQLTPPSAGDAIKQVIGFQPESVADASEKSRIAHMYSSAHNAVRDDVSKQYSNAETPEDKAAALARRDAYNARNPTNPIKGSDLGSAEKFKLRTELGIQRDQKSAAAQKF
jgi:hypothetical protein